MNADVNTDKDYDFIQSICVHPVHLRLNSHHLKVYPDSLGRWRQFITAPVIADAKEN